MPKDTFLKDLVVQLLWRDQEGVCFNCEDALDWQYKVIAFEEPPTLKDMGILCWSCWKDYKKGQKRHNKL